MKRLLTAFLFIALGYISPGNVLAADEGQGVTGTTWSGKDIWGKPISLYFAGDGSLTYKTSSGIWTGNSWRQGNNEIYFEMNKKFVEHKGIILGDEMIGEGWTKQGYKGTWSATRQPTNPDALVQAKSTNQLQSVPMASLSPTEYVGTYEGNIAFESSSLTIRLRCDPELNCELETTSDNGTAKPASHIDRVKSTTPVSNWPGVQRALQYARTNRADRPTNKEYAAISEKLRPLLDSNAVIDKCIDLNLGGTGASLLCRPSASPWKEPTLLFLGASLSPCGQGFCGYVIYPLFKK